MENVLGDNIGFVNLVESMGNDLTVVNSARVSYSGHSKELGEREKKLVRYLLKNNHSSPLEHVQFTFNVKVPLIIERQWNRHRTWKYFSINEVSRRYSSENIEFYIPKEFRLQSEDNKQMSSGELLNETDSVILYQEIKRECERGVELYNWMLNRRVAREIARGALSQFMYVNFYATVDLHNLLWFLELRRHPHAQEEIRRYASGIENIIKEVVPFTYQTWSEIIKEKYTEE